MVRLLRAKLKSGGACCKPTVLADAAAHCGIPVVNRFLKPAVYVQPTEQLLLNLIEPEAPSLENFRAGENAELVTALTQCRAGVGPQFIYIWGAHGSGRSHLLRALTPTQRFRVPEFDERVQLYTVDNIEKLDKEDLEKLFHLMNAVRLHPQSRLVTAGLVPVSELNVREDVATRLRWGLTYRLRYLGGDEAGDEFLRLAKERGIALDESHVKWIKAHCPRDMRGLRMFLDTIDERAMREQKRITVAFLDLCLKSVREQQRNFP